jgi:hypothetical protein
MPTIEYLQQANRRAIVSDMVIRRGPAPHRRWSTTFTPEVQARVLLEAYQEALESPDAV